MADLRKMRFIPALILLCTVCSSRGENEMELLTGFDFDDEWIIGQQELRYLDREFVGRNTRFFIWTRDSPYNLRELINGNETSLKISGFRKLAPTKIFAHGFSNNGHSNKHVLEMRNEYLKREDCNFISVDWERVAMAPYYIRAAIYSEVVGELTGQLINYLVDQGADLRQFHVIGFSLGAHVAGKAGAVVNGLLPRITGLDPAYPFFSWTNTDQRLDKSDAEFVDVIHTNSGFLFEAAVSFPMPIGHVDFYPNGGYVQPGCLLLKTGEILDLLRACSHTRAPEYFIESINSPVGFRAVLCDSWIHFRDRYCYYNPTVLMGEPISQRTRGMFFLVTNKSSSFAIKTYK